MVEHRPLSDIIAYAILTLGVFIVAFPVYLALIASTHDAATVVGGNMPLSPGSHTLENYYRAVFVGGSRTSREPVGHMLFNSFVSAFGIIDAVTGGGPAGATTTMVYKVFADGRLGGDLGGSAAQSVVLMVIVIALTAVQFKYIERKVQY